MDPAHLAQRTRSDAGLLTDRARRLQELADRLGRRDNVPEWFGSQIEEQIARCRTAAADLNRAAERLDERARATPLTKPRA